MTSPIGSSTGAVPTPSVHIAQQIKAIGKDSDGDNDGSKVGEVEKPTTPSGTVGTIVNTKA